jgi:hypothetical protein
MWKVGSEGELLMGLYLCVFDGDEEVEGVEVGPYADFNFFRETVVSVVEQGQLGSRCPVLTTHHDSDGEWSPDEASQLLQEFDLIEKELSGKPPVDLGSSWKKAVAKKTGVAPPNLLDCFFDVDGEPLVLRLRGLAEKSVQKRLPILFQ